MKKKHNYFVNDIDSLESFVHVLGELSSRLSNLSSLYLDRNSRRILIFTHSPMGCLTYNFSDTCFNIVTSDICLSSVNFGSKLVFNNMSKERRILIANCRKFKIKNTILKPLDDN